MAGTKELTELLRMGAVLTGKCVSRASDGEFSKWDGIKVVATSIEPIWDGIAGLSNLDEELRDLSTEELEPIIEEVQSVLEKTGKFTFRERDIAGDIVRMIYRDIRSILAMVERPPTAETVP